MAMLSAEKINHTYVSSAFPTAMPMQAQVEGQGVVTTRRKGVEMKRTKNHIASGDLVSLTLMMMKSIVGNQASSIIFI